mmetsp:Transcript_5414/g.15712  ORF Transcript_5414/g.15712 Transcript_5414/m.15712 type:complete len:102 (-) Transcript_5414:1151-1456(-)
MDIIGAQHYEIQRTKDLHSRTVVIQLSLNCIRDLLALLVPTYSRRFCGIVDKRHLSAKNQKDLVLGMRWRAASLLLCELDRNDLNRQQVLRILRYPLVPLI